MITVRATLLVVAICGIAASLAVAQPPERREAGPIDRRDGGPADGPGAGPQFRVLPPFAQRELQLTPEQQKQIEALEADVQAKMQKILTPEQLKQWTERRSARGQRPDQPNGDRPGADRPNPPRRESADEPKTDRPRDDNEPRRPGQGRRTDERRDGQPRGDQANSQRRSTGPMERVVHQLDLTTEQQAKVDKVLQAHHEKTRALFRQAQADVLVHMKEVLTDEQFQKFAKALENGPPGYRRRDRAEDGARAERDAPKP